MPVKIQDGCPNSCTAGSESGSALVRKNAMPRKYEKLEGQIYKSAGLFFGKNKNQIFWRGKSTKKQNKEQTWVFWTGGSVSYDFLIKRTKKNENRRTEEENRTENKYQTFVFAIFEKQWTLFVLTEEQADILVCTSLIRRSRTRYFKRARCASKSAWKMLNIAE